MTVTEIAPGVDLERDILGQAKFLLRVSDAVKTMNAALFRPAPFGLDLTSASAESPR